MTPFRRRFLEGVAADIALHGAEEQTVTDEDAIAAEDYARSLGVEVKQVKGKVMAALGGG